MRKNSPRKWLHAILDLLPVLILPIFALAVRSDNNFQPIEIQAQENKVVDFNQLSKNEITAYTDQYGWYGSQTTLVLNGGVFEATPVVNADFPGIVSPMIKPVANHVYVISCYFKGSPQLHLNFGGYDSSIGSNLNVNDFNYIDFRLQVTQSSNYGLALFVPTGVYPDLTIEFYNKINVFDLTQMFGSGNEPTLNQFRQWYSSDYYDFTLSRKELVKNYNTITYNDTDVGSQMVYTLYNATDKYFNFNNVFNFGQIYDWFVLNIFNGNATLIFPVVWQIVLYEFIMDLVFLIYALFMFFIDFCTNLIDRFHVKCSGGK